MDTTVGPRRSRLRAGALLAITAMAGVSCGTRVEQTEENGVRATRSATAPDQAPTAGAALGGSPVDGSGQSGGGPAEAGDPGPGGSGAGGGSTGGNLVAAPVAGGGGSHASGTASVAPDGGSSGRAGPGKAAGSTPPPGARPSDPGQPTPSPTPTATVPGGGKSSTGAARSPAVIASVGTLSGPGGAVLIHIVKGTQVWIRAANQGGGLNGHPIKLITYDDGGDPARHRAQVQEAVERQKAIAFLTNVEVLTGQSSVDYINSKRIPVIGTDTATPWAYASPMYFPQTSVGDAATFGVFAGIAQQLVPAGKTRLATIACVEAQFCADADRVFAATGHDLGFEGVYRGRSSLAQPDFTAECLSARNAAAEVFLVFLDSASLTRVAAACARQGFRPIYATASGLVVDRLKDDPNLEGMVAGTNVFPSFQSGTAATDEYQQAMRAFGEGKALGEGPPLGWAAGKILQRAGANLGEPPTSEALLQGLWSIRNETLGGLVAPLTFVADKPVTPRPCWFRIVVQDRRFTSPDGFGQQCRPLPAASGRG